MAWSNHGLELWSWSSTIQNAIARVVTGTNRRQHITTILQQQLHWLPIRSRIDYKIAIITFKTLKTGTPAYLANLLQLSTSSATHRRLQLNHSRTAFGRQAFSHSSATVWNSLPSELTSNFDSVELNLHTCTFRRQLKTHLFKKHFNLNP